MNKKSIILKLLFIFVLVATIIFLPQVMAAPATQASSNSVMDSILKLLDAVAKVFLALWYVPAIIAGKLLTNDFVYGEVFMLDRYLWLMWNIMKTFALYFLGFYFVILILRSFFRGGVADLSKKLGMIFVSGVLINFSWFIMGVVIDFSTIMITAVGSFPMEFFGEAEYKQVLEKNIVHVPKKITIVTASKDAKDIRFEKEGQLELTDFTEQILSRANNMSATLMYFGFAMMRFQDYYYYPQEQYSSKNLAFTKMIKIFLIIMFVLPLIVLAIVNMFRIVYIWFWVMFSPFIILDIVFGGKLSEKAGNLKEKFSVSNIIGLIFQPVAVIACLSLGLILASFFMSIFGGYDKNSEKGMEKLGVKCDNGGNQCKIEGVGFSVTFIGSVLSESESPLKGGIGYIIVAIMTIFMLWSLLKVGFQTSALTKKFTDGVFNFVEQMGKSVPFVPTPFGTMSVGAIQRGAGNLQGKLLEPLIQKDASKVQGKIQEMMGLSNMDIPGDKVDDVQVAFTSGDYLGGTRDFFAKLLEVKGNRRVDRNSSMNYRRLIEYWVSSENGKRYLREVGIVQDEKEININDLLSNNKFIYFIDKVMSTERSTSDLSYQPNIKSKLADMGDRQLTPETFKIKPY